MENVVLASLTASQELAAQMACQLKQPLSVTDFTSFSDGELLVKVKPSLRGQKVFLIQSTCPPVNDHLMELLILIQSVRLASAKKINVVIPYYGYARQDRKSNPRGPITSKLVANLLTVAGADRVLLVDIHSQTTLGFFNIPVDNISLFPLFCLEIIALINQNPNLNKIALISPDYGGLLRIRKMADLLQPLKPNIIFVGKSRPNPNESEVIGVLGHVKDRICFIVDDMIDTGGSIVHAAQAIKAQGAVQIFVLATHGLFSGSAEKRLGDAVKSGLIKKIIVSNTIKQTKKIIGLQILDCSGWIASFVRCLIQHESFATVYQATQIKINQAMKVLGKN